MLTCVFSQGNPEEHTILEFAQLIKSLVGESEIDPHCHQPHISLSYLILPSSGGPLLSPALPSLLFLFPLSPFPCLHLSLSLVFSLVFSLSYIRSIKLAKSLLAWQSGSVYISKAFVEPPN